MGLIDSEKNDGKTLTAIFIWKFKTDQDLKAKEKAWAEAATIKQKKDETVRAYGERAVRLAQYLSGTFWGDREDAETQQSLLPTWLFLLLMLK